MRWLHCFLDDRYQMLAQLIEIDLITQCRAESCESLGSVIFAAVEAAVDEHLDAPAQRVEESCHHQCGGGDGQGPLGQNRGLASPQGLQGEGQTAIDSHPPYCQDGCSR